ncbi:hypothetical protein AYX13_04973 [Cryptococcus neoformans]|nr:hypothetical protein AYX13_04973 [Cryptococcus neoformans var. grubii]
MSSPAPSSKDPLELESLDADSLFAALTGVEKAIPELLMQVKPILTQLSGPIEDGDEERRGIEAREGVEQYMSLLDKIQFVLRQTVYYLRETRSSPNTLRAPPVNLIPTPFASTIPSLPGEGLDGHATGPAELGLYASRIEAKVLKDMEEALGSLRSELGGQ